MSRTDLEILRLIDEVTAYETGAEFFRTLVRNLAEALQVRMAFVSRFSADKQRVSLVAWWNGERYVDDVQYDLVGTPCELVLNGEIVAIDAKVAERYPTEAAIGAESYLAIPLNSKSGDCIGHLAVIDTHEVRWEGRDFGILRLFAARATTELMRLEYEQELQRRLRLEKLVTSVSSLLMTTPSGDLDAAVMGAAGMIGVAGHSDRVRLFRFIDDDSIAKLTHEWLADGVPPTPAASRQVARAAMPAIFDRMRRQEVLFVPDRERLPETESVLRDALRAEDVRATTLVPLAAHGRVIGGMGLHAVGRHQEWRADDLQFLRLLGEVVAAAILHHEQALALAAARDSAESASRAKSDFLASMSHELRTPLNGILGYAQLLRRDAALHEPQLEAVRAVERCGEHLLTLINDVLDLARIEAGRMEANVGAFDLQELLRTVADVARVRALQAGLRFAYEMQTEIPRHVATDERKLRQILLNLLGNAVKFTTEGAVRLRVGARPAVDGVARLWFEVEDTGPGIPADELERIFEPFHQVPGTGGRVEGTGLGLSISRNLARLLGGRLQVHSELGHGSTFRVSVDAAVVVPAVESAPDRTAAIAGYEGPPRRVLIADDREDNRRVLAGLLRPLGFDVVEVHNGSEALASVAERRPDVVLMDLVMPVMDGFKAIRELRALPGGVDVPVVAMSASVFEQTREQSVAAGFREFVTKPVDFDALLRTLERLLDLQWRYAERHRPVPVDDGATPRESPSTPLPASIAGDILDLARAGDVEELRSRLDEIERESPDHAAAVRHVRSLAARYDMRAIRRYLESGGTA